MAWKPKEKQLTAEEAIALAKKELAPFWHGSEPLLAGVRTGQGVSVHPLDPSLGEKAWLVLVIDPTDFAGQGAVRVATEWHRRYESQGLGFLVFLKPVYQYLRSSAELEALAKRLQIPFPSAIDSDGLVSAAFKAASTPKVILLHHGKTVFERSTETWTADTELQLQKFLRRLDPGLPLPQIYDIPAELAAPGGRIELGAAAQVKGGNGALFPSPGFAPGPNGFRAAAFRGARPRELSDGQFFITGNWLQDGERIATSDPAAAIGFKAPMGRVSVIAQSLTKIQESARITVELGDGPVYDAAAGEHLTLDEDGQSIVRVEGVQSYEILSHLPAKDRQVTLRFPFADRVSVAIYGLRFGR